MWQLFTGAVPFEGVPNALWGHKITVEQLCPSFPAGTPAAYVELAQSCWVADARSRWVKSMQHVGAWVHACVWGGGYTREAKSTVGI